MYDDSVRRVLNLMKTTFEGGPFKTFYDGDPDMIPDFNLPALVVTQARADVDKGAIEQDDVSDDIIIKVILNKKDDWANDVDPENMTERKIRELIFRRDPTTGHYLDGTVIGALRKFGTEGIVAIGEQVAVEYGVTPRGPDVLTAEGHVTFSLDYTVNVDELP